ncbi:MAG: hypothetical protein WEB60_09710 [Terrimicrobiaceae bacterium]
MKDVPGFRFKNNKLYAFSKEGVMVLEAWPVLKAFRKGNDGAWEEFTPSFRLVQPNHPQKVKSQNDREPDLPFDFIPARPLLADQRRRAFHGFRASMPKEVAAAVERFRSCQWGILQLIRDSEGVVDLARLNPALAFALGNFARFITKPATVAKISAISKNRQRDIAGALGFPNTEAAVKILAKIPAECVTVDCLVSLRHALVFDKSTKILSHMKKLNAGILDLMANPEFLEVSSPTLLEEVAASAEEKYKATTSEILGSTLYHLRRIDPTGDKPIIPSIAKLHTLSREAFLKDLDIQRRRSGNHNFPTPPLTGTCDIEPILTTTELVMEGETQKNCVADHSERIFEGKNFIYRVLRPQRATLSIVKDDAGNWQIGQLKCSSNTDVSPQTRMAVESWMAELPVSA